MSSAGQFSRIEFMPLYLYLSLLPDFQISGPIPAKISNKMAPHVISDVSDDSGYTPKFFKGSLGEHETYPPLGETHNVDSLEESKLRKALQEPSYILLLSESEIREIEEGVVTFLGTFASKSFTLLKTH